MGTPYVPPGTDPTANPHGPPKNKPVDCAEAPPPPEIPEDYDEDDEGQPV